MQLQSSDKLHRYLFNQAHVRGELVQLQDSYKGILDTHDYPPVIQRLLGELMAAASLLTATLKFEGDIALQLQGEGAVKYAVINGTHKQQMRGVARWDEQLQELPENFADLFVKGVLVITITPAEGERYQGMVALDQPTLAACIENYFTQSEQLATQVMLRARAGEQAAAAGMLLQVLPTSSEATASADRPEFEHLAKLTETLTDDELFGLEANDILYRLYHQEDVEVFTPQPVVFQCTCSKARSATALANVDKQELLEIIAEQGQITMHCQYCNTEYRFDAIDVESIHAGNVQGSTAQQ